MKSSEIVKKFPKTEPTRVELYAEKIELAVPQLMDFGKKAQSIYLDARNLAQKSLIDVNQSFDKGESKLIQLENELDAIISRIENSAKEIGVDIYSTKVGKNMKSAKSEVEEYAKSFSIAISKVKSLKI